MMILVVRVVSVLDNNTMFVIGKCASSPHQYHRCMWEWSFTSSSQSSQEVGYDTIIIDDCWLDLQRTADGALQVIKPSSFPNCHFTQKHAFHNSSHSITVEF